MIVASTSRLPTSRMQSIDPIKQNLLLKRRGIEFTARESDFFRHDLISILFGGINGKEEDHGGWCGKRRRYGCTALGRQGARRCSACGYYRGYASGKGARPRGNCSNRRL